MKEYGNVIWLLYNVLFAIGYTLMLPHFLLRMWRRGGYRKGFLERLAFYPAPLKRKIRERPRVWIHAVSVGEIYVALRYMEEIREQRPGSDFVLSTTTSTGHRVAEARLNPDDVLLYYPSDFPGIVRHALNVVRPVCLVLTESELWPNMIRMASRRGIPVVLINGRISHSSYKGYRLLKPFFSRVIGVVDLILVQTENDRRRLLELGGRAERIHVMGSAKYDVADTRPFGPSDVGEWLKHLGWDDALLLLGGSTWPGEERILIELYARLRKRCEMLRLVLVPRHAERGDEVEAEVLARDLTLARRSRADAAAGTAPACPDVAMVDTTGELMRFYECADVIFVGKSLTSRGGQNIIEPAAFGKPVIVGPHMDNFPDVLTDLLESGALLQVADAADLERVLDRLLNDASEREALGSRARQVVESKRGVVHESVEKIVATLS